MSGDQFRASDVGLRFNRGCRKSLRK